MRRQFVSALEGDSLAGEQVRAFCCLSVERGEVRGVINVDRHKNPLFFAGSLKDKLFAPHMEIAVAAVIECRVLRVELCVCSDGVGQFIPLRFFDGRAEGLIAIFLRPSSPHSLP